jgi:hypothetical protein
VKLIGSAENQHQFQLEHREKQLLFQVLRLYPRIPPGQQPLSKTTVPDQCSNQRLLDEALEETRLENKKHLQALLADPLKVRKEEAGWRLTLSGSDVEWLLQVLNDIRIGSWIELGSPEVPLQALTAENAPHFWAMEMAGSFQMRILELLRI